MAARKSETVRGHVMWCVKALKSITEQTHAVETSHRLIYPMVNPKLLHYLTEKRSLCVQVSTPTFPFRAVVPNLFCVTDRSHA